MTQYKVVAVCAFPVTTHMDADNIHEAMELATDHFEHHYCDLSDNKEIRIINVCEVEEYDTEFLLGNEEAIVEQVPAAGADTPDHGRLMRRLRS